MLEGAEEELVSTELVAVTVKLYDVPLLNPVIVVDVAVVEVAMMPPGLDVILYNVTVAPFSAAAPQMTLADDEPTVALRQRAHRVSLAA
jgi:hypothetical protein